MNRTLSLRKESLIELTHGELRDVAGGASLSTCIVISQRVCMSEDACVTAHPNCATRACGG